MNNKKSTIAQSFFTLGNGALFGTLVLLFQPNFQSLGLGLAQIPGRYSLLGLNLPPLRVRKINRIVVPEAAYPNG